MAAVRFVQGVVVVRVSTYSVPQMDCSAEEQLVLLAVADLAGIERVRVDLDARSVAVAHDTDRVAIDDAMTRLGLGARHLGDVDGGLDADTGDSERPALRFALGVNLAFFFGELLAGLLSRSMGLVADGLDMGADAAVYAISLAAVGTTAARKLALARASGLVQLALAVLGLLEVGRRVLLAGAVPDSTSMAVVSALALVGNVAVLVVLRRVRTGEAHIEASWIFTANDVLVNLLVLAAAGLVAITGSAAPDLVTGALIFLIVANGARRILALRR